MKRRLYTSLVQAKMEMNDGELPAMVGVPKGTAIDPKAVLGMGGLIEHATFGLLCPVKNCGKHFHKLTRHLNETHHDIGGSGTIRYLLGIPDSVPLVSFAEQRKMSKRMSAVLKKHDHLKNVRKKSVKKAGQSKVTQRKKNYSKVVASVTYQNLRNTCDAQLKQMFEIARKQFGRIPLEREMRAHYPKYRSAAIRRHGTWNKAIAAIFNVPDKGWYGQPVRQNKTGVAAASR